MLEFCHHVTYWGTENSGLRVYEKGPGYLLTDDLKAGWGFMFAIVQSSVSNCLAENNF